jgi:hypothetical protein
MLPVGFHLSAADLWLGRKPLDSSRLPRLVWDIMVCQSGSHTCHGPRPLRCSGYCSLPDLVLVEQVAERAAVAALIGVHLQTLLPCFMCLDAGIRFCSHNNLYLPAWHVVLVRGSGLCVCSGEAVVVHVSLLCVWGAGDRVVSTVLPTHSHRK